MEEINIDDITLFEEVESNEAKQIYFAKKKEYNNKMFLYSLIILGASIILNIIMALLNVTPLIFIFSLIPIPIIIGIFIHFAKLIKPFKDMYWLAYENDRTRHKAKLFYKEFKRQEKDQINNKITKEEIINSNTRASKEINIEKLKEINKKGKN